MKPGMTRWKMVPLYWPFFTYFKKLSTVRGAACGSSSTTNTPMDVVNFTWGLGPAPRATAAKDRRAASRGRIGISGGGCPQDSASLVSEAGARCAAIADRFPKALGWNPRHTIFEGVVMPTYQLTVNGRVRTVDADTDTPLLWVLRDTLGFTGTKFGCGQGVCGACTVHLDGQAVKACQISLKEAAGHTVVT